MSESGTEGWTFPGSEGADVIVFLQAWQADKTLDRGRDGQFAIELEKAKSELGKMKQSRPDQLRVALSHQGASACYPRILLAEPVRRRTIGACAD